MPKSFEQCVKHGGEVRIKTVNPSQYMHICIPPSGKSVAGEVKTKKSEK